MSVLTSILLSRCKSWTNFGADHTCFQMDMLTCITDEVKEEEFDFDIQNVIVAQPTPDVTKPRVSLINHIGDDSNNSLLQNIVSRSQKHCYFQPILINCWPSAG